MSNNPDFWGYQWTKKQAINFMGIGCAISGVIVNGEFKKWYEVFDK